MKTCGFNIYMCVSKTESTNKTNKQTNKKPCNERSIQYRNLRVRFRVRVRVKVRIRVKVRVKFRVKIRIRVKGKG